MDTEKKMALLIDADNISPSYLDIMLREAKNYGMVIIRRIYGDWTSSSKSSWKGAILDNSLTPIQQYSYTSGKNASDCAMIIDAMDILYEDHVDGFILASSDSDFTRLATRLRESGKIVIGMGESKTPSAFVKSCDEFKVLDLLFKNTAKIKTVIPVKASAVESHAAESKKPQKTGNKEEHDTKEEKVTAPITPLSIIVESMLDIIEENSDAHGEILLSELGRLLTRLYSDFDPRNYGKNRKLVEFVKALPQFEVRLENSTILYVRKAQKTEKKRK